MFIYADESGHSGRMIFNDPPYYYQGAIFATADVEPALLEVGKYFCQKHNIPRVHSNEMRPDDVVEFAEACLDALNGCVCEFILAKIHKPYIATTKFVDTVFDYGENLSVPFMWYNHDFFRHSLCCLFDDVLTDRNKRQFWEAYLNEDFEALKCCIRNAKTYLPRYAKDKRLYSVALDGLNFVLSYPDEITILARGKKQYKPHTPNMIGFNVILQATRKFAKKHNVTPVRFIHDRQSEFGSTMREYHRMFSNFELIESDNGFPPTAEVTDI